MDFLDLATRQLGAANCLVPDPNLYCHVWCRKNLAIGSLIMRCSSLKSWGSVLCEFFENFWGKLRESPRKTPGKSRNFAEKSLFGGRWSRKKHSPSRFRVSEGRETMRNRKISSIAKIARDKISKKFCTKILERFWWKSIDFWSFFDHALRFPRAFRRFSAEKWGRAIWKMGAPRPNLFRTPKSSTVA